MAGGTFPTSIPSYTSTVGSDVPNTTGGVGLSGLLNAFEVDITALGTKVGTGSSTPAANTLLYGTGTGTSAWQGLTSAQLASIVSDETGSGALVFGNSPTIVTPTIASFTNANHTHANSAGGGQLTGSTALVNSTVTADKLATGAAAANVATSETTTSTSYTDLTTTSDTVTVTIGANGLALLILSAEMFNNTADKECLVSFAASGANTISASDGQSIGFKVSSGTGDFTGSYVKLLNTLSTGSTTFKMKYRVVGGTGSFSSRHIAVIPL